MRVFSLSSIALLLIGCTSGSSSPEPSALAHSPSTEAAPPSKTKTSEDEEPSKAPIEQPPPLSKGPGAKALSLRPETVETSPEATNAFSRSSNAFAIDLYGHLRKSQGGNLAFSPASIEVALAMTWAGADGETNTQMAKVLHLPEDRESVHGAAANLLNSWNDPERDTYELRVVNRLFGDKATTFGQPFLNVTRQFYAAELEQLDFRGSAEKSRAHINQWVEAQTNKKIQNLLPEGSISELTRLVLTNAVYFLGRWSKRFEEARTQERVFHAAGGQDVRVPMMHQTQQFRYARLEGLRVLEMGYVGDELAMMVVLPDANDGLPELEGGLSLEALELWAGSLREQRVKVFLPRFRVEPAESIRLKHELIALGMPLPFQPQADFTKMSNPTDLDERLYIDNVYHKAFVEVDEAGTEAAAATAVVMRAPGSAGPAPSMPEFRADHPFLFFIRDLRTGTILFVGRVNNPSSPS